MTTIDHDFWKTVVETANGQSDFQAKSEHLIGCVVSIVVGDSNCVMEFHRGRAALLPKIPPQGVSCTITGNAEAWQPLLTGAVSYPHATGRYGTLRLSGTPLAFAWAGPALNAFFRITTKHYGSARAKG